MSKYHFYIQPFNNAGNYTGTYVEVSDDVSKDNMSRISQQLDNTEYDVGILRNSSFSISLGNYDGKYSDVNGPSSALSIFQYKRSDSIVKITWEPGDHPLYVGFFVAGAGDAILSEEIDVFYGLLNDDSSVMSVDDQTISFNVLGAESKFLKEVDGTTPITNGTLFSAALNSLITGSEIYTLPFITGIFISCGTDQTIDDASKFNNRKYSDLIEELLFASNSILYISLDGVIHVSPRTPTASVQYEFFGQASILGIENIVDIVDYKSGIQRVMNYLTWEGVAGAISDSTSIAKYNKKQREFSIDFVTNSTKRNDIRTSYLTEFATPKQELILTVPLNEDIFALNLLDRVTIDFPNITFPNDDGGMPVYGVAQYGVDKYPDFIGVIEILPTTFWKIMTRAIDTKTDTVDYSLREI